MAVTVFTFSIRGLVGANYSFYKQGPDKDGRKFRIIKIKTIHDLYDEHGELLTESTRITRIGKIVRASSLDEMLWLINVLKGELSFVGPRPLLNKYMGHYAAEQLKRYHLKPCVARLAQGNGSNSIPWENKF